MSFRPASISHPVVHRAPVPLVLPLLALVLILAAGFLLWPVPASSRSTTLPPEIRVLRVALDPGALPLSNGERDYTSDGLEVAYARDLATWLGLEVKLVPLKNSEQAQALKQGQVDVALRRHPTVAVDEGVQVMPTGYASGLSVAMRTDTDVKSWSALAGRLVCVPAGNARARDQANRVGARLQLHPSPAQALVAVRTGACAAAVLDQAQLNALLGRKEWWKFSATLPPTEPSALELLLPTARMELNGAVRAAVVAVSTESRWAQRRQTWASNVAFEVYFDQTGPDCH